MNYKIFILTFLFSTALFSQQTSVNGKVVDDDNGEPLANVSVELEDTSFKTQTSNEGAFSFSADDMLLGEQVLILSKENYKTKRFPIIIEEGKPLELGELRLSADISEEDKEISLISLSDNELDAGDNNVAFNVSGLLQSSKDVFPRPPLTTLAPLL